MTIFIANIKEKFSRKVTVNIYTKIFKQVDMEKMLITTNEYAFQNSLPLING